MTSFAMAAVVAVLVLVLAVFPVLMLPVFLAALVPSVLLLPFLSLLQPLQLVPPLLLHALPLPVLLQVLRIHVVRLVSFQRLPVRRRDVTTSGGGDSRCRIAYVRRC